MRKGVSTNPALQAIYNKHGMSVFEFRVLFYCSRNRLYEMELRAYKLCKYMGFEMLNKPDYVGTAGMKAGPPRLRKALPEEWRKLFTRPKQIKPGRNLSERQKALIQSLWDRNWTIKAIEDVTGISTSSISRVGRQQSHRTRGRRKKLNQILCNYFWIGTCLI
jgi:hypothetical protein